MSVADHYDASAENYHQIYEREGLRDLSRPYPANYHRLQLLLNAFVDERIRRVIEVGVGEGTPLATLAGAGISVAGFDISEEMVFKCKQRMSEIGQDPDQITWGDIEDPNTYSSLLKVGQYEGLMAMGVMPHVVNEKQTLLNMKTLLQPGGTAFIEFRNKLFSLFTFNRHTFDFIMDDLLAGVDAEMKDHVASFLKSRLEMNQPPSRDVHADDESAVGYDKILSKFHNPFEVLTWFDAVGFSDPELLWYHYHPGMPHLAEKNPEKFRSEGLSLEHDPSGWRGFFLCSAFVVKAKKPRLGDGL